MRIEKIILKNYRQLRDIILNFNKEENDLHLFVAQNGTAKTNILNAINWCLYNDEPHTSKESQKLPILNLNTLAESERESIQSVSVEIHVNSENRRKILFKRVQQYIIDKDEITEKKPWESTQDFVVTVIAPDQDAQIYKDEDAISYVERFVPKRIREFYFFDGERLDSYFKDVTGSKIKETINEISGLDELRNTSRNLKTIMDENTRVVTRNLPEANKIKTQLEKAENLLKESTIEKEECIKQINQARVEIKKYDELLKDVPNVDMLEERLKELIKSKKRKIDILSDKQKEKEEKLFEFGKILIFSSAINDLMNLIKEKEDKNELPPLINKDILEESIHSGKCEICKTSLNDNALERLKTLIQRYNLSQRTSQQLTNIKPLLEGYKNRINNFKKEMNLLAKELKDIIADVDKLNSEINDIENKLSNYPLEKIRERYLNRKKHEEARDINLEKSGNLQAEIDRKMNEITVLETKLENELKKEEKAEKVQKQNSFVKKALSRIDQIIGKVSIEIKNEIEEETNRLFMKLIWKKSTYEKVLINDDYVIELIHVDGFTSLGSTSAAERELLALSFTLALHKISGFEGPLIIDTPVARISDINRNNMGRVLKDISIEKQMVLLFTPSEYSKEISDIFDPFTKNKFKLTMKVSERDIRMEVF